MGEGQAQTKTYILFYINNCNSKVSTSLEGLGPTSCEKSTKSLVIYLAFITNQVHSMDFWYDEAQKLADEKPFFSLKLFKTIFNTIFKGLPVSQSLNEHWTEERSMFKISIQNNTQEMDEIICDELVLPGVNH